MSDVKSHQMKAAITRSKGASFTIEPATIRAPKGDEVLVRVVATGMCHTDMIVRDQYYPVPLPAVLGHEGSGVIEAVGPGVKSLSVGDHVILTYGYCAHCIPCNSAQMTYCDEFYEHNFSGVDAHGECAIKDSNGEAIHSHFFSQSSFATLALSLECNTIKVPNNAPLELLGPLGCGIQTGAGAVINTMKVTSGSSFVAFGGGAVGLSAILAAKLVGAGTIVAVDVVESRLDLAKSLGATHTVNPKNVENVVEAIQEITHGGANYALESTGVPTVLRQAIDALGKMGTVGVVGAPQLGTAAEFDVNDLLLGGKTIRGIVEGDSMPKKFIPELVDHYMQGRFPFDKLIKMYSFEDINQAVADSESGLTLKPVLKIGEL